MPSGLTGPIRHVVTREMVRLTLTGRAGFVAGSAAGARSAANAKATTAMQIRRFQDMAVLPHRPASGAPHILARPPAGRKLRARRLRLQSAGRWCMGSRMHTETIDVRSRNRDEMIDITDRVAAAVRNSGVTDAVATIYVPHTTAGVTINENADPSVVHDVLAALDAAVPWRQGFYRHGEGNSAAHVKSSLVGCSAQVLVRGGRLVLGTWQGIYFCEFDGPRSREAHIAVG